MKRVLTFALCAIMMAVCSAQAQDEPSKKQRISREELAEKQAKHIAYELAFDNATAEKFIATYQEYQKEVWALGLPKKHDESVSVKERLDHSQKILDLRKKYYKRYSEFLTDKQIERAYELEHQAMRRLVNHRHEQAKQGHRSPQNKRHL